MSIEQISALLIEERDRLNRAIEALGGGVRRGRPARSATTPVKRGGMSAAKRREVSERMKAYWAARRKGKSK